MKRITNWLESKFSPRSAGVNEGEHHGPVRVSSTESVKEETRASDQTPTLPTLVRLDKSCFDVIETTGFDPYNSGSFESSKSRSHK
jgi:hypothetical protein